MGYCDHQILILDQRSSVVHVELLNGQSAELREADSITRGERTGLLNEVRAAAEKDDENAPQGLSSIPILAMLVDKWTLPIPIPREDPASVDALLALDFNALDEASSQIMRVLLPTANFGESTEPDSPTKPSSE